MVHFVCVIQVRTREGEIPSEEKDARRILQFYRERQQDDELQDLAALRAATESIRAGNEDEILQVRPLQVRLVHASVRSRVEGLYELEFELSSLSGYTKEEWQRDEWEREDDVRRAAEILASYPADTTERFTASVLYVSDPIWERRRRVRSACNPNEPFALDPETAELETCDQCEQDTLALKSQCRALCRLSQKRCQRDADLSEERTYLCWQHSQVVGNLILDTLSRAIEKGQELTLEDVERRIAPLLAVDNVELFEEVERRWDDWKSAAANKAAYDREMWSRADREQREREQEIDEYVRERARRRKQLQDEIIRYTMGRKRTREEIRRLERARLTTELSDATLLYIKGDDRSKEDVDAFIKRKMEEYKQELRRDPEGVKERAKQRFRDFVCDACKDLTEEEMLEVLAQVRASCECEKSGGGAAKKFVD